MRTSWRSVRAAISTARKPACFNHFTARVSAIAEATRGDLVFSVLCRPGGISGEPEPDPIPNSAVKLPCADGTKSQGLEE